MALLYFKVTKITNQIMCEKILYSHTIQHGGKKVFFETSQKTN